MKKKVKNERENERKKTKKEIKNENEKEKMKTKKKSRNNQCQRIWGEGKTKKEKKQVRKDRKL